MMRKYEGWTLGLVIISVILGEITSPKNIASAQIQPDNTLGTEPSIVKPDMTINDSQCNPCDLIEGGVKRGNNLFHSFEKFNVNRRLENDAVQSVYFSNQNGVERIFSRVTGQSRSEIMGKLGVLGNADLFLINPNGIFFGPGASLDLRGSFISTTADSVVFENGSEFSASNPSNPALLTVNIPIGLRFRESTGDIINLSFSIIPDEYQTLVGLQVNSGKTLALIGGNITLSEGGLITATDGRIELGSIASPGQVTLHLIEQGWTLSYESVENFQDINLTQRSQLQSIDNGDDIQVTGRRITITSGSQIVGQASKKTTVTASDIVEIQGRTFDDTNIPSAISNQVVTTEDGGLVTINTRRLIIRDGGKLLTSTSGLFDLTNFNSTTATGNGGNLLINATESVELTGDSTEIASESSSFGDAGNITINTRNLSVKNGAIISAQSTGVTLVFELQPPTNMLVSVRKAIQTGRGGNITINATESIKLDNSALISVETLGLGKDAGNITVKKADSVILSNSRIATRSTGQGNAGNLTINTNGLALRDKATISASTISSQGGNIELNLRTLDMNKSEISASTESGQAGNLNITATDSINLNRDSRLTVENRNRTSGNLLVNTPQLILQDDSIISASTNSGRGGNIYLNLRTLDMSGVSRITASTNNEGQAGNLNINATDSINLNQGSRLTVEGEGEKSTSGNLFITTPQLTLQNGAKISAETTSGIGGNIQINLQNLNVTKQSDITASTQTGQAGDLNIYATDTVNVNGGSRLSVEAEDGGAAGNLTLTANSLNLNRGTITAVTQEPGNEGANIRLQVADIIKLQNESKISATSTGTANGGNITINTRFLIAYPPEGPSGSDITADSNRGAGGKIDITAQGVFGTQRRDEFIRDANTNRKNDITAFSRDNPQLNGVIDFNTPDIDPTRGLVQFPTVVINPAILIEENYCIQQDVSQLVISGRGGLPPSIIENISDRAIEIELVKPVTSPENQPSNRTKKQKSTTQTPIIPARGWVYNKYGEVVLTAYDPTAKASLPHRDKESVCPAP